MNIWLKQTSEEFKPSSHDFYPTLDFANFKELEGNLQTFQVHIPPYALAVIEKKTLDYVHNYYIPYFTEKLASYNVFFCNPKSVYYIVYDWLSITIQKYLICEYQLNIIKTNNSIVPHFADFLEIPTFQSYEELFDFLSSSTSVALAYKFLLKNAVDIHEAENESIQSKPLKKSKFYYSLRNKLTPRFMYTKEHSLIVLVFSFVFEFFKSDQNYTSKLDTLTLSSKCTPSDSLDAFVNSVSPFHLLKHTNIVINSILSNYKFKPRHYRVVNHDKTSFEGVVLRALSSELNEHIVSIQHGINYGTSMFMSQIDYTEYLSSIFISLGWFRHVEYPANIKPAKISCRFKHMFSSQKTTYTSTIIFVETCPTFSDFRINSYPIGSSWLLYFQNKLNFFDAIPPHLNQYIIYRPHPASLDSQFTHLLQNKYKFKTSSEPIGKFVRSINRTTFLVFDHPSSLFLFCMKSDIPCIIYFDTSLFPVSEGFTSMLYDLEKVSIFHRTAESASHHLSKINDVDNWWKSYDVTLVKSKFVNNYADFSTSLFSTFFSYLNIFYGR